MERSENIRRESEGVGPLSLELEDTYRTLHEQLQGLRAELARTRGERDRQLRENTRLAQRLQVLLASLPAAVVVLDRAGRVCETNAQARALLGPLDAGTPWATVEARAFAPQRRVDGCHVLGDGRLVQVHSRPLLGEPGRVLLIQDVTERQRLQEEIARSRRLSSVGEMTAALAHQIRTPLASARLYLAHLERPGNTSRERARVVERLRGVLQRLEGLVDELLLFSRAGTPQGAVQDVAAVLETLRRLLGAKAAQVAFHCPRALARLRVTAGEGLLATALLALLDNALQASRSSGGVALEVRRLPDGRVEFAVHDDGPGIERAMRKRVFEPFFTTRPDGTGLGLPIAQGVAEAHGGELVLDPPQGSGTTFRMRVPPMGHGLVGVVEPEGRA